MNDLSSTPTPPVLPGIENRIQIEQAAAPTEPKKPPFIRWRRLLTLAAIYASTEAALDISGLDTLANYSEFIENGQAALQIVGDTIVNLAHLIN
jgi:hypothetical protein